MVKPNTKQLNSQYVFITFIKRNFRIKTNLERVLLCCNVLLILIIMYDCLFRNTITPGDDLPFPTPRIYRQHHMCNFQSIPYVSNELASAYRLLYSNYSFIRFGDLDIDLINGVSWPNQKASENLSRQLMQILEHPLNNVFIGIYDPFSSQSRTPREHQDWLQDNDQYRQFLLKYMRSDQEYLSTLVTSPYILNKNRSCFPVKMIYDTLRNIWMDEDIVLLRGANGQEYQYDVYDTAKSQTVLYAPRYQAYEQYEYLREQLMSQSLEKLYILSAGPVAKILAYDLAQSGRRALDLGHLAKDYDLYMKKTVVSDFFQD